MASTLVNNLKFCVSLKKHYKENIYHICMVHCTFLKVVFDNQQNYVYQTERQHLKRP